MVRLISSTFKNFFYAIQESRENIFRSGGLVFIYCWLIKTKFLINISSKFEDEREKGKIKYSLAELIPFILLHILDGDRRISHYDRNPNRSLFLRLFKWDKIPDQSTILKTLQGNPTLSGKLNQFLLEFCVRDIVSYFKKNKCKQITIDVDQTAREIHGKQQGVATGYSAGKRNARLFQIRIYSIRELKQTMRVQLMPGNMHSSSGFSEEIRPIAQLLKKAGITGIFVGDSGFESGEVCDFLHEQGHKFIFAVRRRKEVKKRGKYSKNKKSHERGATTIKERFRPVTNKFKNEYREIYVRVLPPDKQLYFYFAADEFTNIFVANLNCQTWKVYRICRKHAVIETIIEELKNDFGMGIAHAGNYKVNASMTACAGIVYNIKNRFLVESGMANEGFSKMKLSTFQAMYLHTPGEVVRHFNRNILKISPDRFEMFKKMLAD